MVVFIAGLWFPSVSIRGGREICSSNKPTRFGIVFMRGHRFVESQQITTSRSIQLCKKHGYIGGDAISIQKSEGHMLCFALNQMVSLRGEASAWADESNFHGN